ncbi:unannotated protein [freshwater metagenome]|uniref:Unannotated protein n=1 Tax=freshwater metagenome TaxID=449393 RepID=A0A6J7QKR3_9ZZZZ
MGRVRRDERAAHGEPRSVDEVVDRHYAAEFLDDSCEHVDS